MPRSSLVNLVVAVGLGGLRDVGGWWSLRRSRWELGEPRRRRLGSTRLSIGLGLCFIKIVGVFLGGTASTGGRGVAELVDGVDGPSSVEGISGTSEAEGDGVVVGGPVDGVEAELVVVVRGEGVEGLEDHLVLAGTTFADGHPTEKRSPDQ